MVDRFRLMDYLRLFRASGSNIRYLWYFLLPLLLTAGLRETGATRQWDLFALDRLMTMRPPEAIDDRIVIVTIDEEDLKREPGGNSISDKNLAKAIEIIATAKPSAIGVDIIRDGKIEPELANAYRDRSNVIGLAKLLPPDPLPPPTGLSSSRVGFGDYEPDADSLVRRATLAVFEPKNSNKSAPKYSFAWQIAKLYLQQQGKKIQIEPDRLELGSHSIPPFRSNNLPEEDRYFEILVNYRNNYPTFLSVKLADVLAGKLPNLDKKIVLIGYTASTKHDFVNTFVVPKPQDNSKINGSIYGIEYHGHIISQLISTPLNDRSLIQPLSLWSEYLWIFTLLVGSTIIFQFISSKTIFLTTIILLLCYTSSIILSIYTLFCAGWWVSIGWTLSIILIIYLPMLTSFIQRQEYLLEIAEKRRQAIADTFNAIHNGPLQELSLLLRAVKSDNISLPEVSDRLEELNQHIRKIGESLQIDTNKDVENDKTLVLGNGDRLDLDTPLNELFGTVAELSLNNEMHPILTNLKIKVVDFKVIPKESKLSTDDKRQLCQFLEESIGNMGKYAEGATRVQLIGKVEENRYRLSIEDNGRGTISDRVGDGTKQAQRLAKRLKGEFTRIQKPTPGVICAIEWTI